MTGADWAQLLTILATLATALAGYLKSRTNTSRIEDNNSKLDVIHVLVNSQRTAMLRRIAQLTDVLVKAGVDVPDVPGIPDDAPK